MLHSYWSSDQSLKKSTTQVVLVTNSKDFPWTQTCASEFKKRKKKRKKSRWIEKEKITVSIKNLSIVFVRNSKYFPWTQTHAGVLRKILKIYVMRYLHLYKILFYFILFWVGSLEKPSSLVEQTNTRRNWKKYSTPW